jgi:hypothetical protein
MKKLAESQGQSASELIDLICAAAALNLKGKIGTKVRQAGSKRVAGVRNRRG